MVTMKNETPYCKPPLRSEFFQAMSRRFPMIDMTTIGVISQVQSLARTLSAGLNSDLACHGLTEGKFYVLVYLFSEELTAQEDPSPSDIAENLGVTRGTITGLLDGLEREGYVERCHDSRDRRALTIKMTDKTRQFLDGFLHTSVLALSHSVPLDEAEKCTLTEWLSRIENAMRAKASGT